MHYVDMLYSQSDQTIMEKSCKSGSFKKHINKEFFFFFVTYYCFFMEACYKKK